MNTYVQLRLLFGNRTRQPFPKFIRIISILIIIFGVAGCTDPDGELRERKDTINTRFTLFMSLDGILNTVAKKDVGEEERAGLVQIAGITTLEVFKFLNGEIEYLNSIKATETNKAVLEEYRESVGNYVAEHMAIFRFVFVEGANKSHPEWGSLSFDDLRMGVLRQKISDPGQKESLQKELNNLKLMRVRTLIVEENGNESVIELDVPDDTALIPIKM